MRLRLACKKTFNFIEIKALCHRDDAVDTPCFKNFACFFVNRQQDAVRKALFAFAEETARKAYDVAAKSYLVGRSTITDLNSAQLALTQAQLAVSQAIYEFVLAKAGLEETLGYDFTE